MIWVRTWNCMVTNLERHSFIPIYMIITVFYLLSSQLDVYSPRDVGVRYYCFPLSLSVWNIFYFSHLTRLSWTHNDALAEVCVCVCVCVRTITWRLLQMSAFCLVVTQIALMGGLLHLVQRRRDWVRPQPAQASPRCTKCNSPLINVQCIHQSLYDNLKHTSDIGFLLCSYPGGEKFRTRSYFKVRGQGQRHFSEGSVSLGKDVSYCVAGSERVRLRLHGFMFAERRYV